MKRRWCYTKKQEEGNEMKHKKGKDSKIQSCPAAPSCVPSGHRGTAAVMMQLSADPEGQC